MHIVLTSAEGCGLCKTLEWRPKAGDMWDLPVPVLSNLVVFTGCPSGLPCAVSIDEGALAFRVRTATSGKHTASGQHIGSYRVRVKDVTVAQYRATSFHIAQLQFG
jgi:hypothetical protein